MFNIPERKPGAIALLETAQPIENNMHLPLHYCALVIHPETNEIISSYKKLIKDPLLRKIWVTEFGKEFGNLAQGDGRIGEIGTHSIFALTLQEMKNIPKDRTVTYALIVVDFRPQKDDPNRVRITAGCNLINYPDELTTQGADLTTSKVMWNSVISTKGARYKCIDIKSFYLGTPLKRFEYMKFPIEMFPQHIIDQYGLPDKVLNSFVYVEIQNAIYRLPQVGRLASQLLKKRLKPDGIYEVPHTPGLWKHTTRPIQFTLVVDNFGVKYTNEHNCKHLVSALRIITN